MKRRPIQIVVGTVLLLSLGGCGEDSVQTSSPAPPAGPTPTEEFCKVSLPDVEARIDALLPQMTLEEKVEQMQGVGNAPVGGLYDTADNTRLGIPGFRMADGPRGMAFYTGRATGFPVGIARGATWDPALEERVGEAIGEEGRAKGASVVLAPVTAVVRHPRWGRSQETYGEDPLHIGPMGVGFIRGAQQHVIASVKHFALNSIENTRKDVNVVVDERTLREIYLPHFRMAVQQAHVGSVMAAYNQVNGQHCTDNVHLLHDILKGEWGFLGFVESDWDAKQSTVASANAGLDIEMPSPKFYGSKLIAAVEDGSVPMATIDAAVRRILRTKFCFELDTNPPQIDKTLVESAAHTALALEVAQRAIVLLKNDGALLPLDRSRLRSLAVVGTLGTVANTGDYGSSKVVSSHVVSPLQGIQNRAPQVTVTSVEHNRLTASERDAVAVADAAVVVVGLTGFDEGEGLDRTTLDLSAEQQQLIADVSAINAHTIIVLEGGGAITMESWIGNVPALLMAWYPGEQGGNAIADVLFGDVNPSAKLPLTFARSAGDLPEFHNGPEDLEVTYGYYHGYRFLDRNGTEPRFPFGFGLSYTTYGYANLRIANRSLSRDDTLQVSADVTNTGLVGGDEIVQLYVGYQGSRVDRAVKDLKAFTKVHLDAGETKTVSLAVPVKDLAFYDVAAQAWEIEPISYTVFVGSSSRDLPLSGSFSVHG